MIIPLGVADATVAQWPRVTFGLAAASLLLSLGLWLVPDGELSAAAAQLHGYAQANPHEQEPEACTQALQDVRPQVIGGEAPEKSSSAKFDKLCAAYVDAERGGRAMRLAVQPVGRPTTALAWPLHALAWPDWLAGALGLLLLALVVGPFLEELYGAATFGALVGVAALLAAGVFRWASVESSGGWSGGQGYLAALLAVYTVQFTGRPVKFLAFAPGPRVLELPAWAVALWWLAARALSLAVHPAERPRLFAELAAFGAGLVAGWALKAAGGGHALVRAVAGSAAGAKGKIGWGELKQLFARPPAAPPAAAHAGAAPATRPAPAASPRPASDAAPPPPRPESAPDAAWAVLAVDPFEDPQLPPKRKSTAVPPEPPAAAPSAADLPAFGAHVAVSPLPNFEAFDPPTAAAERADEPPKPFVFDFAAPPIIEDFAGQGSGFSSPLPSVLPEVKAQNPIYSPAPAMEFSSDWLDGAGDPQAPNPDDENTAVLDSRRPFDWPTPPNSPYDERTAAYSQVARPTKALSDYDPADPTVPRVRLGEELRRDPGGFLAVNVQETPLLLQPGVVKAVAVGVILHANWPGAAPEVWIDLIIDAGGARRPADAVRLHLGRADLQRALPQLPASKAFVALLEELSAPRAYQLPQQPVWPGPPFPTYATAADFIAMWLRELHG